MFCPKCGKQIDDDSVFCEFCGENVEETPAADPFQTVYADNGAYDNNDYTDNYADNYADDYNNAYPANFTEPEPMPTPAPEKSGKKMIAAVCAVCSVMLVLMAVLCAKFIFGGKKIQTDDPSANSLAAAVTTTADSLSVVAEESSAAETAVTTAATTAATTAPAAKSEKKAPLSAIQLKGMTVSEIRDYVGDDYDYIFGTGKANDYVGITSDKYFSGIMVAGMKYNGENPGSAKNAVNAFLSSENDDLYPSVYVLEGTKGLIGYDLNGDEVRSGLTFEYLLTAIDCLNGVDVLENRSRAIIEGYVVDLYFDVNLNGPTGQFAIVDMSDHGENVTLSGAEIICNVTENTYMSGSKKARIVADKAPLINAPEMFAQHKTLETLDYGDELYIGELYDPLNLANERPTSEFCYEVRRYDFYDKYWNKIVYKVGYIRADMIEFE